MKDKKQAGRIERAGRTERQRLNSVLGEHGATMPASAWQPGPGGIYNVESGVLFKPQHAGQKGAPVLHSANLGWRGERASWTLRTAASKGASWWGTPQIRPLMWEQGRWTLIRQPDMLLQFVFFGSWKDCQPSEAEMRACCCKPCVHDLRRRGFPSGVRGEAWPLALKQLTWIMVCWAIISPKFEKRK